MANFVLCENYYGKTGLRFTYSNELERSLIKDDIEYGRKKAVREKNNIKGDFHYSSFYFDREELEKVADDIMTALSIVNKDKDEYKKEMLKIFPFIDEYGWKTDITFKKEMFESLEYIDKLMKTNYDKYYRYFPNVL